MITLSIFIITAGFAIVFGVIKLLIVFATALAGDSISSTANYIEEKNQEYLQNIDIPEKVNSEETYYVVKSHDGGWVPLYETDLYALARIKVNEYRKADRRGFYLIKKVCN